MPTSSLPRSPAATGHDGAGGSPARTSRAALAWVALATGVALALRLLGLEADSLWRDELFTWHLARLPWDAVLGLGLGLLLFAPYVPFLLVQVGRVIEHFWIKPLPLLEVGSTAGVLLRFGPPRALTAVAGLAVLASVLFLPSRWRALSLVLGLTCWVIPALAAHLARPLFQVRYALVLAPLAIAALANLFGRIEGRRGVAALLPVALLLGADAVRYQLGRPYRERWREACAEVALAARDGARPVVVEDGGEFLEYAVEYYARGLEATAVVAGRGPDGERRVPPLPPGRLAIVARPGLREAILRSLEGRTILREAPLRHRRDQVFIEAR